MTDEARSRAASAFSPQAFQTLSTLPALRALGEADRERLVPLFREDVLPRGACLFREGDTADSAYVIVSGEVRITAGGRPVAHLGPGEWFGEMALLTGSRRSATVDVTLDSRLLVLDADAFTRLVAEHPALHEQLFEILSRRLSRTSHGDGFERGYEVVVVENRARWPERELAQLVEELAGSLERELRRPVAILHVLAAPSGRAAARPGSPDVVLAVEPEGTAMLRERVASRLAALRLDVPVTLVVPDQSLPGGGGELAALADTLLVLTDDPLPAPATPAAQRRIAVYDRRRGTVPAWSDTSIAILPRIRRLRPAAIDRLARCLARRTVGLALGSGAAYGFAHIGVLAVLEEAGIPVDCIAGASMGAIVGAGFALGMSPAELAAAALRFGSVPSVLPMLPSLVRLGFDVNVLRPGMFAGERFTRFLGSFCPLRDADFTDVRLPFRAVATDIQTGARVELGDGRLADALRASFSAPWIFSPHRIGDRLLVDGGMADPVPSETARAMGADVVIAVNAVPALEVSRGNPFDRVLAALARLNPLGTFDRRRALPASFDVVMKCLLIMQHELGNARAAEADVLVSPALGGFWFLEFWAARELIERGAEAARAALPAIRRRIGDGGSALARTSAAS